MKKILLMLTVVILATSLKTKAQSFTKGNHLVKAGFGFPTIMGSIFSTYENEVGYKNSSFGPMYLKYEHALTDKIGLGLNIAYTKNEASYTENVSGSDYKASVTRTSLSALARLNFHFANSKKFDPYFGPGIGYRTAEWTFKTENPNGSTDDKIPTFFPFGLEFTIGANYYLTDNIGLYAEAGIAKSPIQFGLVGKF